MVKPQEILAIIGLGNPGVRHYFERHTVGFRVLDACAEYCKAVWIEKEAFYYAQVILNGRSVILIKPQTYMNNSGDVIPFLQKKGISAAHILVVHDELEKPFGFVGFSFGKSHKGHNGLKSIIARCGNDFWRLKIGIGRPLSKEMVPEYVLSRFCESESDIDSVIEKAITLLLDL